MRRILGSIGCLAMLLAGAVRPAAAQLAQNSQAEPPEARVSGAEAADPLEPWSLEVKISTGTPPPSRNPVPIASALEPNPASGVDPATTRPPLQPSDADRPERPADPRDLEKVQAVTCRQLLIADPQKAARLATLLRSGASFEDAQRALGHVDVVEQSRDYALEELAPDIRAEIASLPVGGWSTVRPWRGRSAIFQVVAKDERERRALPQLGRGLGTDEQNDLAADRRQVAKTRRPSSTEETADFENAAVVTQVSPEYPPNANGPGEVTVQVQLGASDDVIEAIVMHASDPVFEFPARDAARRSQYRSARRNGIPEKSAVTLTFKFVAPQAPAAAAHD
jgi:hypothetical protein